MSDSNFQPKTREEYLACELAERLGDPEGFALYLKVATRYSESYIRSILSRVLEVPTDRIRTSRGALFNWLIQHHGAHPHKGSAASDPRP